jgi:predicted metal-dependent peptidase
LSLAHEHPLLGPMLARASVIRNPEAPYPREGWATVTREGRIYVHAKRIGEPREWLYVLGHCVLHLGFGHFQQRFQQREWDLACECVVWNFLFTLKLGEPPEFLRALPKLGDPELPARTEDGLFRHFCENGIPANLPSYSLTGTPFTDMIEATEKRTVTGFVGRKRQSWEEVFGQGLAQAVTRAVEFAGGTKRKSDGSRVNLTLAERARRWFVSSYPLLGALASAFEIIEDPVLCGRMQISVAAVSDYGKEIYINPGAGLSEAECRFVIAHELLHVSLRHSTRCRGRDSYLWNVACDYVINEWLTEMRVGSIPQMGLLLDDELKGLSAEAIYDRIVTDLRRFRRLGTFRGIGLGDILDAPSAGWWNSPEGTDLDSFYRSCLAQGLAYHHEKGRGLLPAGLIEEIRALNQPAIPWDVELARWLDDHFSPLEQVRTYARPSRRQSSTPDIPRPKYVPRLIDQEARTFGVVLDTSSSMSRILLGESLGAIASYCESRDVLLARVVFCDAVAYDAGYMRPDEIAGRVKILGRGGTILQPGIDLLERADNFPKDGPILIITDGACDHFRTARDHAILLPEGRSLPFPARGRVFRLSR